MKIAVVTDVFLPTVSDGVAKVTENMIRELSRFGHEFLIFAPSNAPETFLGFPIHRLPSFPIPKAPDQHIPLPLPRILRALKDYQPDLVFVLDPRVLGYGCLGYARWLKLPTVAFSGTEYIKYATHYHIPTFLAKFAMRTAFNFADLSISVSCHNDQLLADLGVTSRRDVWNPGVDVSRFSPMLYSKTLRMTLEARLGCTNILLFVGRLMREKSVHLIKPILDQLDDVGCVIVGEGASRSQLEDLFRDNRVFFSGELKGRDLGEMFATVDCFVFPSMTDSYGLVLLESLASGVPVVGFDAGGVPDIIRDRQNGFLIAPGDTNNMARAIRAALSDDEFKSQFPDSARETVEERSWKRVVQKLEIILTDFIRQNKED